MIPQRFVELPALPRNENGKIDRKTLPGPPRLRHGCGDGAPPRTAAEDLLAGLWKEALGLWRRGREPA